MRRYGSPVWDVLLRTTGVIGLCAIPLAIWLPPVAEVAGFLITTIWVNGPLGIFFPATYEPILMILGRLYPALGVAAIGTAGIVYIEAINYVLYRKMFAWKGADRVRESRMVTWSIRQFRRAPFLTVWLCGWSPLPYWVVRFLAPMVGYPLRPYLVATALGRFPRLWFFATLGTLLRIPGTTLLGIAVGTILLYGLVAGWRLMAVRRVPSPTVPLPAR
jgi:uncharacterized membrane protein YdjX (TVP38/TMEM64 family)